MGTACGLQLAHRQPRRGLEGNFAELRFGSVGEDEDQETTGIGQDVPLPTFHLLALSAIAG